jgi:hypothetical protein
MKYFFLPFLVLLFGCTKTETTTPQDTLPPLTQVGANTAGCVINGKVLVPKNGTNSINGGVAYGLNTSRGSNFNNLPYGNDYFSISISNLKDKGHNYWIYVYIDNLSNGIGQYMVEQSNGQFFNQTSHNPQIIVRETYDGVSGKTYLSSYNSGTINITRFDFNTLYNTIISGTFNATLYNDSNPSETIQVTDGRFDLKI